MAEILALLAGDGRPDGHRLLREHWSRSSRFTAFELVWKTAVRDGLLRETASPVAPTAIAWATTTPLASKIAAAPSAGVELVVRPDPRIHDGRYANNLWLLELPQPPTKISWNNAALVSPATAARLGVTSDQVATLTLAGRSLEAPVFVTPGHADDSVTLHLGFGRSSAGEAFAQGVGVRAASLQSWALHDAAGAVGLDLRGTSRRHDLARTQKHWTMDGRPIVLSRTMAEYRKDPAFVEPEQKGQVPSLLPPTPMAGNQWAMSIDLAVCTGCSACMVACQAENNTPSVGREQVLASREMYWIRIDTYYSGSAEDPTPLNQPMLCQHCEKAPCEYVCPVNATVHSWDGLNEMVYNRCVGTRFCSNNCPYKVRRFNWFNWEDHEVYNQGLVKLQRNPDVTVRQRGVMEKCSYCVQRIREAEIHAAIERRGIGDGEVVPACAQACPTRAIVFGSITNREAAVVRLRAEPRNYQVLAELGTQPRTQYLAKITNPKPGLG